MLRFFAVLTIDDGIRVAKADSHAAYTNLTFRRPLFAKFAKRVAYACSVAILSVRKVNIALSVFFEWLVFFFSASMLLANSTANLL